MPQWNELDASEKDARSAALKKIYEAHGNPKWLGGLEVTSQTVNVLMANQQQKQVFCEIEGKCGPEDAELAATLSKEIKEALAGIDGVKVNIAPSYGVGAQFPVVKKAWSVFDDKECDVEHKEGEVILYDFWATWCPPCQAPMAHNQKMLEDNKEWAGKVRLIGLSIDNDAATVKNHVENKGWKAVEHYHIRREGCVADKEHGIQGVPHVVLVDTKGKIVYKGHPASRELEKDINDLLAEKEITGAGTQPSGAAASEESAGSGKSDDEYKAAADKFAEDGKACMEANKDLFAKFQRAFLVLVHESKLDYASGKWSNKMTCHTQLMGKADDIKAAKELLGAINKNDCWKNEDQERAM